MDGSSCELLDSFQRFSALSFVGLIFGQTWPARPLISQVHGCYHRELLYRSHKHWLGWRASEQVRICGNFFFFFWGGSLSLHLSSFLVIFAFFGQLWLIFGRICTRAFYPSAVLSAAAILALLTLATRFDVTYPSVYCWAVVAIVAADIPNRGPVGLSLVSVVGSLTFLVLLWHIFNLWRGGTANLPPLLIPDPERARRGSLNARDRAALKAPLSDPLGIGIKPSD